MINKPLILISNDDSVYSEGIKILVEIAQQFGEVVVVAPDSPQSAKSHSVTLETPIFLQKTSNFGNIEAYKCSGTPADSVKIALHEVLNRKPDLILSGINHGSNTSVNIFYSGTMAAAIEGCLHDIPSIGLSITTYDTNIDFSLCRSVISQIITKVLENGLEKGTCLNVNIPHIKLEESKGIKVCKQTSGIWAEEFNKRTHPHQHKNYFWLTGKYVNFEEGIENTDMWAIKNNYTAIVPVKIDMTNYNQIDEISNWF